MREGSRTAAVKAVAIVAYFALTTVWLPSRVLRLNALGDASDWVVDVVGTGIWALFLGAGIWGLRIAQRRGLI